MTDTRGKLTQRGMGAVQTPPAPDDSSRAGFTEEEARSGSHGVICPEPAREEPADDPRPLAVRDTIPAPSAPGNANASGGRRHFTLEGVPRRAANAGGGANAPSSSTPAAGAAPVSTPARPITAPPASARGRYSSQPADDEIISTPPASGPKTASKETLRRSVRQALRVDDVGATKIVAKRAAEPKPRVVDRKRIANAPLSARDAFVLRLVDGTLTVQELVDAAGFPEREVTEILARLVQLGIVSLSS